MPRLSVASKPSRCHHVLPATPASIPNPNHRRRCFFFFQAEDGIRDIGVTGVQTCALPIFYALDSFPLVAVPVFIFVGNLMNQSGITEVIYRFATTLVARVHGGLAQVNIVGSLIFSGMSGAALADIGGLGRIEVRAMSSHGFKREFAGALTCASAIVGPIFPPSIPLIIYGSATNR